MTLSNLITNEFQQRIGLTILHSLWQGAGAALLLWPTLALLRKKSPQIRYAVASLAMAATLVATITTFFMVSVSSSPRQSAEAPTADQMAPIASSIDPAALSAGRSVSRQDVAATVMQNESARQSATSSMLSSGREMVSNLYRATLDRSFPFICNIWILGVLLLSIWHFGGLLACHRLRRLGIQPVSDDVARMASRISRQLQVRSQVQVVCSLIVETPIVVGWLSPMVLVPVSVLTGLTSMQLEAVIAHELAHVRRHDYLVNLFQVMTETLLFFHPAIWWMSRQIRIEREQCCDDIAISVCGDPRQYAQSLVAVEEARVPAVLAMAASGSGSSQLRTRIERILEIKLSASGRPHASMLVIIAALAATSLVANRRLIADDIKPQANQPQAPTLAGGASRQSSEAAASNKPASEATSQIGEIRPSDLVLVAVEFEKEQLKFAKRVDLDGTISVPYVGKIKVAGLRDDKAEAAIQGALHDAGLAMAADVNLRRIQIAGTGGPVSGPIGACDLISVSIWDLQADGSVTTRVQRVPADGMVKLPYLDAIKVAGLTDQQLEIAISDAYRSANIIRHGVVSVVRLEAAPANSSQMDLPDVPVNAFPEALRFLLDDTGSNGRHSEPKPEVKQEEKPDAKRDVKQ